MGKKKGKKKKHMLELENRNQITTNDKMYGELQNPKFVLENEYAIRLIEFKLKMIDIELSKKWKRSVVQNLDNRIKSYESIVKKLQRKNYDVSFESAVEHLNDIAGIRAVCFFVDDVYEIAEILKKQKDLKLIKEKDYIKEPKKNGYQSLHLIMQVPFYEKDKCTYVKVEVQLRTAIMDSWAELDNQLCYKKEFLNMESAEEELKAYSKLVVKMDKQMLMLRKQIKNPQ